MIWDGQNLNSPHTEREIEQAEPAWMPIDTAPEDIVIETKIDDEHGERNVQALVKRTREAGKTRPLFWFPDGSMYVYYEPTHWRPKH